MTTDDSDAALLTAWRAGDARAGSDLVARHAHTVLWFFRRKLDHGAEDLTQRTFLAAVEGRDRVKSVYGFRAYILGIARHEYTRAIRHKLREAPHLPIRSLTSPSGATQKQQDHTRLLVALRQLPLDLQITIELHYWEEMTTKEIAAVLGVAPGTIKWRLSTARGKLAAALDSLPAGTRATSTDHINRWIASMRVAVEADDSHL
ncbi:MAG: sigma-70 family RNA polymerase sigma factor [Nannocystaceae bacterium]|nr:sigma-70 family RNA polymerase sigma factor [Nannocystaceae bacterium]